MRAADPRVCPRAENAESDQKPEDMLFQRAAQIPVKKAHPHPCTSPFPLFPSFLSIELLYIRSVMQPAHIC